jgi:hypothetical protein
MTSFAIYLGIISVAASTGFLFGVFWAGRHE